MLTIRMGACPVADNRFIHRIEAFFIDLKVINIPRQAVEIKAPFFVGKRLPYHRPSSFEGDKDWMANGISRSDSYLTHHSRATNLCSYGRRD